MSFRNRRTLIFLVAVLGVGLPLAILSGIAAGRIRELAHKASQREQQIANRYATLAAEGFKYRIIEAEGTVLRFLDLSSRLGLIESFATVEATFPGVLLFAFLADGSPLYEPGEFIGGQTGLEDFRHRGAEFLTLLAERDVARIRLVASDPESALIASLLRLRVGEETGLLGIVWNRERIREWAGDVAPTVLPAGWEMTLADRSGRILARYPAGSEPATAKAVRVVSSASVLSDNFFPWRLEVRALLPDQLLRLAHWQTILYAGTVILLFGLVAGGTWLLTVIGLREMEVTRLRTQFVANVSHEFRTPVALLRAAAEALLRRETMDQAKKERYLGIIERETRRLSDLVETVLALTKAREHPEMYRLVPTDICRLTREVVDSMRLRLEQDGFRVEMNVPEGEIYVRGDGDALQLVLLNLLDNAIKFSPDRKEIRVEVDRKNAEVVIQVSDKGIGIAEDDRGRIFEPFHRVEHDLVKKTRGTGIGLALAREVVRIHHGSIEVTSGPGQGSTFTIILPAWTGKTNGGTA